METIESKPLSADVIAAAQAEVGRRQAERAATLAARGQAEGAEVRSEA